MHNYICLIQGAGNVAAAIMSYITIPGGRYTTVFGGSILSDKADSTQTTAGSVYSKKVKCKFKKRYSKPFHDCSRWTHVSYPPYFSKCGSNKLRRIQSRIYPATLLFVYKLLLKWTLQFRYHIVYYT